MRALAMMMIGGLFVAVAAAACQHEPNQNTGTTTVTGAPGTSSEQAVYRVNAERCKRERTCNNVGEGMRWTTIDDCTHELDQNTRATLRVEECPKGIDETRLSSCLSDISNQRCGNPVDAVSGVAACRQGALCR